jgi:hypothetical protein
MVRLRAVAIRRADIPIEVSFQMSLEHTSLEPLFLIPFLDADLQRTPNESVIISAASPMQV